MKKYQYTGEATGFLPGIGSVKPGSVIEATSEGHEEAIKASGHFKLDRPHREEKPQGKPAPKATPKPEAKAPKADPKPEPSVEPKADDTGEGGKE
ncbi:hypothetical protein [Deinococcus alpinitundrae]|uniref:hypothetical protein n=1 Tax=Deinococcus alpinitundrae TaxID=468913 RepID=UPI001379BFD3|nr:hypothetical protein [Deinococcus alpinitundrae]